MRRSGWWQMASGLVKVFHVRLPNRSDFNQSLSDSEATSCHELLRHARGVRRWLMCGTSWRTVACLGKKMSGEGMVRMVLVSRFGSTSSEWRFRQSA